MGIRIFGVLLLLSLSLPGCVVRKPAVCLSTSDVTPETVLSIRQFSASIASELDLSHVDNSHKYPSRNIDESETLGIEIGSWDAKLIILSSGRLTPTFCFYGSPDSEEMHLLIDRFIGHLLDLGFDLTMENDNSVDALPYPLRETIRNAVQ